jgi:hypothetical protein
MSRVLLRRPDRGNVGLMARPDRPRADEYGDKRYQSPQDYVQVLRFYGCAIVVIWSYFGHPC